MFINIISQLLTPVECIGTLYPGFTQGYFIIDTIVIRKEVKITRKYMLYLIQM